MTDQPAAFEPMTYKTMAEIDALPLSRTSKDGVIKFDNGVVRLTLCHSKFGEPREAMIETCDPTDPEARWEYDTSYVPEGQVLQSRTLFVPDVPTGFLVDITGDGETLRPVVTVSRTHNETAFKFHAGRSAKLWGRLELKADHVSATQYDDALGANREVETHITATVPVNTDVKAKLAPASRTSIKNVHGVSLQIAKTAELELDGVDVIEVGAELGATIGVVSGEGIVTVSTGKQTLTFTGPFDTFRIGRDVEGKPGAWGWCGAKTGSLRGFLTGGLTVNGPIPEEIDAAKDAARLVLAEQRATRAVETSITRPMDRSAPPIGDLVPKGTQITIDF